MTIIAWLVVGGVAGYIANWILGTRGGLITTVGFGIVGAIAGGAVGAWLQNRTFDFNAVLTGIDLYSIAVAIIGAVVLGAIGGWWGRRRAA